MRTVAPDDGRLRFALRGGLTEPQRYVLAQVRAGLLRPDGEKLAPGRRRTIQSLLRRGLLSHQTGDLTAAGLHALDRRSDNRRPDCHGCAGLGGMPAHLPSWIDCYYCAGSGFGADRKERTSCE